jgi:hypothetical protein
VNRSAVAMSPTITSPELMPTRNLSSIPSASLSSAA